MTDLSFTQEFLLCVLTEKGTLPTWSGMEANLSLLAGTVIELLHDGCITMEKKKLIAQKKPAKEYLRPVYAEIAKKDKILATNLAEKFTFDIGTRSKELFEEIGLSLVELGAADKEMGGILHNSLRFIPRQEAVNHVVEKLRTEFLEEGELPDETVALAALLQSGGSVKRYFSKHEADILKKRLKELKASGEGMFATQIVNDMVGEMVAIVAAIT